MMTRNSASFVNITAGISVNKIRLRRSMWVFFIQENSSAMFMQKLMRYFDIMQITEGYQNFLEIRHNLRIYTPQWKVSIIWAHSRETQIDVDMHMSLTYEHCRDLVTLPSYFSILGLINTRGQMLTYRVPRYCRSISQCAMREDIVKVLFTCCREASNKIVNRGIWTVNETGRAKRIYW